MFDDKSIIAIIPARGGSKGLPRKNLRLFKGQSLLKHTILMAQQSKLIDRIIVSSEDNEIIESARQAGAEVPFIRPMELAQDDTPGTAPILHALDQLNHYDYVIVLQTTSPLRTSNDIDQALTNLIQKKMPACVSVCEVNEHPNWMFNISEQESLQPFLTQDLILRRQDLPAVYSLNGAIYAAQTSWFKEHKNFLTTNTLAYIMPKDRSIDIDTEFDLRLAEIVMDMN